MSSTRFLHRRLLITVLCALPLLAGCGRKGPLYLPPPPPAAGDTEAQPPPAERELAPAGSGG